MCRVYCCCYLGEWRMLVSCWTIMLAMLASAYATVLAKFSRIALYATDDDIAKLYVT